MLDLKRWSTRNTAISGTVVYFIVAAFSAHATRCKTPSGENIDQVRKYVARLHNLSEESVKLVLSEASNESCFWKLQFETKSVNGVVLTYLSPDRKVIVSDI